MNDKTEVERAAGLFEMALQDRRGERCSEEQFHAANDLAVTDVRNLLVLEGVPEPRAGQLAQAAKLYARAKRHHKL